MTESLRFRPRVTQSLDFTSSSENVDFAERLWRKDRGIQATANQRARSIVRQALVLVAIIFTAFGFGYGAGKLINDPHAAATAHASGACIALEMAAAHGAIDEVERRMTLRALASGLNPHFERFPEQASEISTECGKLIKGAMSGKIARGH